MGGAASKDFLDGNAQKTTVTKELDELGGYDRPALARNQSFSARLDWLGNQVGKASDQIEAALSKDEQAGRKELEREAKRRQLQAMRRGQGDVRLNLQYADFYLNHKQFERPSTSGGSSILRSSLQASGAHSGPAAGAGAGAGGHGVTFHADTADHTDAPLSPKSEAAKRSAERLATLTRVYSSGRSAGGSFTSQGSISARAADSSTSGGGGGGAPVVTATGNKWRQTVMHAKKTAFMAVGTINALMNGKRRSGPARIDNFAIYAEHQLGDGMTRFAEESNKLAEARVKVPKMKNELEDLRSALRQLAVELKAAEDAGGNEEDELEPAEEPDNNDCVDSDEAAAVAAAAASSMRHARHSANGKFWSYGAKNGDGSFGAPPPLPTKKALPSPRLKESAAPTPSQASITAGPVPGSTSPAGLPAPGSLPGLHAAATAALIQGLRGGRRVSTGSSGLTQSVNGPMSSLLSHQSGGPVPGLGLPGGPGLLGMAAGPSLGGLGIAGGPSLGRTSAARASWSGTGAAERSGPSNDSMRSSSGHSSVGPLRPLRGGGFGVAAKVTAGAGQRSQSEPQSSAGPAATAAVASAPRPASALRVSLMARPPSSRPTGGPNGRSRDVQKLDSPRNSGEYRIGTMASRVKSKLGDVKERKAAARVALRRIRDEEADNVLRQQDLIKLIEEAQGIMSTSTGLLQMYCNRANGRWVEAQGWALPHVHEMVMPSVRRQADRYREVVMRDLREGRLAVQIHVDDDVLTSARLGTVSLWSADPWALLALTHPARTEATGHLVGLGLGVRQLLALATAVEALAGSEALAKFPVVVACHEGQVEAVTKDLAARKLCRFNPDNLIVIVQQRAPGHAFDRERRNFVVSRDAPPRPAGSGYALLALGWTGADAFRLGGPDFSERRPLAHSTLEIFAERSIEWLSSWRLRDLVHYSPESCLNIDQLAYSYALQDSMDANMTMQVDLMDSMQGANRAGSGIVLALKERAAPPPPSAATVAANAPLLRRGGDILGPPGSGSPATSGSPGSVTTSGGSANSAASSPGDGPLSTRYHPPGSSPLGPAGPHAPLMPSPPPFYGQAQSSPHRLASQRHHSSAPPGGAPYSPVKPSSAPAAVSSGGRRPRAGGIGTDGGPLAACDIKWSDVQTPALATGMQAMVDNVTLQTGTQPRLAIAIKRYCYHVPSLKSILTSPSIFRPSVSVGEGGFLYVTFDASDITSLPGARCVAVSYTPRPGSAGGEGPSGITTTTTAAAAPSSSSAPPSSILPVLGSGTNASTSGGGAGILAAAASSPRNGAAHPPGSSHPAPRKSASGAGNPGSGSLLSPGANGAVVSAASAAAAAALLRGRLLTTDADLDTLLWVLTEQDSSPLFRASVSATNTARSRVTAHAAAGIAAATASPAGKGGAKAAPPPKNVIVVAVADDAACPLAVRAAMGIMKPGADCIHMLALAKDASVMALAAARAVAEKFENVAAVTLGDVKSVVQVKSRSLVEDIVAYAESVKAVLLVTGSMSLAAPQGSSIVGSVALSVARESSRPVLVVKPNARLVESAYEVGKKPCLRCLIGAEPSSRPLVRFVVGSVLDGGRGDKLVLVRGKGFDKDMNELTSSRRIMDHLADEAVSHRRFDASLVVRRCVPGSFDAEYHRVADADQCHIVGMQVPEGRGPLPNSVINMLRSSRSAVLLYRAVSAASRPIGSGDGADGAPYE